MPIMLAPAPAAAEREWAVVCLCAAWCRTCDEYLPALSALAAREPGARFVWIDVEDDAEWIGDLEIETFPTLLVLAAQTPVFFGPLPPQIAVLERTLQALRENAPSDAAIDAEAADDLAAIAARVASWGT